MVHRNSTYDSEAYDLMKLYLRFWSLLFSSLDCLSRTLKHGPLGHCYTFIVDTVKQFIPNIKLLECKSTDILLPWSKATQFCPWISIELKQNSLYVKKTSTEPPLAQSSKGTSHMPIYTAFPAPSLKQVQKVQHLDLFQSVYSQSNHHKTIREKDINRATISPVI